jgi:hypothetical protein
MTAVDALIVASSIVGALGSIGAVALAYLSWRTSKSTEKLSKEQLNIARAEAEMRPQLHAEFSIERNSKGRHKNRAALSVEITNNGNVTAHRMVCWIYLKAALHLNSILHHNYKACT